MKRLAILALALALVAGIAFAQDASGTSRDPAPTPAQLEEMKRALAAQQEQLEKLKKEAAERDKALQEMQKQVEDQQKQVQDQLRQTEAAAKQTEAAAKQSEAAASSAAQAAEAAKANQFQAPSDMDLEKPGIYKASISKSLQALLQQPNPNTQMVTPPWAVLKIADNVVFRFGGVIQATYEALQDQVSTGYSQSFYLRRARFSITGNLPENITFFFQTDDPRLGYSNPSGTKNINSGLLIQDAYAQWNFLGHAAALQAGLFLVPQDRQVLTSVTTFLALDLPTWGQQESTILEWNGGRDYGVGLNGAVLGDHLTYRAGVFEGYRQPAVPPAAGSRNSLMFAGRVMYDVFDTEYSYSYAGTNLGKKKILALAGWYQAQNSYKGWGGDVFWDWPVLNGDAVTVEGDYMHYDGHRQIFNDNGTNNTLPEQYSVYSNAGYYFCQLKLQPFVRYEFLKFTDDVVNNQKAQQRFGGGFNYYVYGQNFKIVPYYERVIPKAEPSGHQVLEDFNRFVLEVQGSF
ncbi:MAG TPA: porin [Thermoanaerobaculia bacterium]|nr:porin [Thermoanaerobaculia bacterium]